MEEILRGTSLRLTNRARDQLELFVRRVSTVMIAVDHMPFDLVEDMPEVLGIPGLKSQPRLDS